MGKSCEPVGYINVVDSRVRLLLWTKQKPRINRKICSLFWIGLSYFDAFFFPFTLMHWFKEVNDLERCTKGEQMTGGSQSGDGEGYH